MFEDALFRKANSFSELLSLLKQENIQGAERYKEVRRFLGKIAFEPRIPVDGSFELTPLCNLDCKMCYVHMEKSQINDNEILSTLQWKNIMHQAIEAGMLSAQLTGGECMMYPGFKELYLYLQSFGIEVNVKTNGLMINDNIINFFIQNPPSLVSISIYGTNNDSYEAVTGHRCFDQVFQNVISLKKAHIPVLISVVPNAFMKDGPELLRLLHNNDIPWLVNPFLATPREETGRKLEEASLEEYAEIFRLNSELKGIPINPCCDDCALPDTGSENHHSITVKCGAGRNCFSVNWRGELEPCMSFPGIAISLLDKSFKTAWQMIGNAVNHFPGIEECVTCSYREICTSCVTVHADAPRGHVDPRICRQTRYLVSQGIFSLDT